MRPHNCKCDLEHGIHYNYFSLEQSGDLARGRVATRVIHNYLTIICYPSPTRSWLSGKAGSIDAAMRATVA